MELTISHVEEYFYPEYVKSYHPPVDNLLKYMGGLTKHISETREEERESVYTAAEETNEHLIMLA